MGSTSGCPGVPSKLRTGLGSGLPFGRSPVVAPGARRMLDVYPNRQRLSWRCRTLQRVNFSLVEKFGMRTWAKRKLPREGPRFPRCPYSLSHPNHTEHAARDGFIFAGERKRVPLNLDNLAAPCDPASARKSKFGLARLACIQARTRNEPEFARPGL